MAKDRKTLKAFIADHSDHVLRSWLRAKADGNTETFGNYLLGEFDCWKRDGDGYEYPYQAMCDTPVEVERLIWVPHAGEGGSDGMQATPAG